MGHRYHLLISRRRSQRLVCVGLLGVFFIALAGLPAGVGPQRANKPAQRFPCEACACGCPGADFCWDRCCCHSDREKLRWADRHGVRPPDFLVKRVALNATPMPANSHQKQRRAACAHRTGGRRAQTCDSTRDGCSKSHAQPAGSNAVFFWKTAQCRGLDWFYLTLSCVVVMEPSEYAALRPPVIAWIRPRNDSAPSAVWSPEPPVP